jgi:hypothetical protein
VTTTTTVETWHGTRNGYINRACRCDACKAAHAAYQRNRRARGGGPKLETFRATNPPTCVHCDRRIVGIPDGWKHVNDNRQRCADGREAAPRVIA